MKIQMYVDCALLLPALSVLLSVNAFGRGLAESLQYCNASIETAESSAN